MKVKNIAFSGFAAAILAAGAANAAPQIASKQYVDDKVKNDVQTLQTTIENNYTKTEQLGTVIEENITNAMTATDGAIKTELDKKANAEDVNAALADKQDALTEAQLGAVNSGITSANVTQITTNKTDIATLKTDVAGKADKITVTAEQVGNVATLDANGQYQVGTVKAADLATTSSVTTAITDALKDGGAVDTAVDAKITAEMAEGGAINTALAGKANADDVYTKEAADAIFDTKIPVPSEACQADSGRCVLSVVKGSDGKTGLSWIDVTAPLEGGATPAPAAE